MQKILIAGGTGLIGSNLITKLKQKNYQVILLTTQRKKADNKSVFYWNPAKNECPAAALQGVDVCINLCGAGIFAKRFTASRKKELTDSRIMPAQCLLYHLKANHIHPVQYISGSATGYYENICSDKLTEDSTKGSGFISDLVKAWEDTARAYEGTVSHVAIIRTGIVLSEKGGFLKQLTTPVRYFAGAAPGSGQQVISWVHIDDLSDLFIHVMEHKLSGTFNGTADQPESIQTLLNHIAKTIHRPLFMPNIPVFMLRLLFGERYYLVLTSQHVMNTKIKQTGFKFRYSDAGEAIRNLLKA